MPVVGLRPAAMAEELSGLATRYGGDGVLLVGGRKTISDRAGEGAEVAEILTDDREDRRGINLIVVMHDNVAKLSHLFVLFKPLRRQDAGLGEHHHNVLVVLRFPEVEIGDEVVADIQAGLHGDMQGPLDGVPALLVTGQFRERNVPVALQFDDRPRQKAELAAQEVLINHALQPPQRDIDAVVVQGQHIQIKRPGCGLMRGTATGILVDHASAGLADLVLQKG